MSTAAGWARRHTADVPARWCVPGLVEDARLVVSELVGNAAVHVSATDGPPAAGRLVLKLYGDGRAIEVWDPSPDIGGWPCRADALSESGRGLAIVEVLCGTAPLVFAGPGGGKTVVAVLARPS
jgi:anti-sigma regulatory factor (Ser/Thr protein kinase)